MSDENSPSLPLTLVRFGVQGVALAAVAGALVGLPFLGLGAGFGIVIGALVGGPAGVLAGLGAWLASRVSRRTVPIGIGGALGAVVAVAPVDYVGAIGPYGIGLLAVAAVGAGVASPLTYRRLARTPEPTGVVRYWWMLAAATVLEGAALLILLPLEFQTFSTTESCDGIGGGNAHTSVLPPQVTCPLGDGAVELVPRGWHALILALAVVALALATWGVIALLRCRSAQQPLVIASAFGGFGMLVLVVAFTIGLAVPPGYTVVERPPAPVSPSTFDPDAGEEEPIPLDPGAGLPEAPELSDAYTVDALILAMQQLADESFATAGPIDDPEIPAGTQTYPVQTESCGTAGTRVVLDIWFATGHNAAGLDRIEAYWSSLGYTVLTEPGHVAAAGRAPLPAESLDLVQTWDEDDLELQLRSLCVATG